LQWNVIGCRALPSTRKRCDLSRLEAGAARSRPELWTADDLVGRALETLGPAAERVQVRLPEESVAAVVDGAQAERILVNLLENAAKFSSATDPIEVSAGNDDNELVIRVRDHGPGVPPNRAARIFDPFESSSPGTGMGLGLAIATGFAQANGGRVWFEPAEHGGAVFALALPAAEVPAEVRS
jgi:two-component system sensor histidine kinase KdpD